MTGGATKAKTTPKPAAAKKMGKAAPTRPAAIDKATTEIEPLDAISLLKADHRAVDALFDEFEHATRSDQKARIVSVICEELKIHTLIEEEIFYPAIRSKIDPSIVDEGIVEHDGAKFLINDLAKAKASDDYYDAKVKVLSEEIRHHVHEEEKWLRGMFAQARRTDIDMIEIGTKLAARKAELKAIADTKGLPPAEPTAIAFPSKASRPRVRPSTTRTV